MIYDSINNIFRYNNIPAEICAYLLKVNELAANGRYELENGCYAMIQRYATKNPLEIQPESHRKYVDLQYIIDGSEIIEIMPVNQLKEKVPYNKEKDIILYENSPKGKSIVLPMKRGTFAVFYPDEAHKACLMLGDIDNVLKAVIKIPVELLQKQELAAKLSSSKLAATDKSPAK